jgi:hypothetical protein
MCGVQRLERLLDHRREHAGDVFVAVFGQPVAPFTYGSGQQQKPCGAIALSEDSREVSKSPHLGRGVVDQEEERAFRQVHALDGLGQYGLRHLADRLASVPRLSDGLASQAGLALPADACDHACGQSRLVVAPLADGLQLSRAAPEGHHLVISTQQVRRRP